MPPSARGPVGKTVQNHLNFLHGIFALRDQARLGDAQPGRARRPPAGGAPRAPPASASCSREELEAVLRAVPDDELGAIERALYLCAAMTGLRQGELIGAALARRRLDRPPRARRRELHARRVRLPRSRARGRAVPMADRVAGELERHFQRSRCRADDDLVFAHPLTGHVLDAPSCASASRSARRAGVRRAHLPRAAPHVRHADGRRRRAAARDPGVDGPRRRQHDRDLRRLRARSLRRGALRRARVRRRSAGVVSRRGGVGPAATPRRRCGRSAGACRC